jgi:hypothetical protein
MAGAYGGLGNAATLSSLLSPQNASGYQLGSPASIGGGIGQRTGLDMGGAQGLIIRPA